MSKIHKHEFLMADDFYEFRSVGTRAKSNKHCEYCGKSIPMGTPHEMAHFYPEFEAYAVHKECTEDFMASLRELTDPEYPDPNDEEEDEDTN